MYLNNGFPALPSLKGLKILVVDNDIDSCDLMKILLHPYGVEVRVAFLVKQALEILVQWQPDVLVSEIALPKEDGYALIRQVRKLMAAPGKDTLALAVTGYADQGTRQRALSAGFDMWFAKPLNFDDFLAALNYLAIGKQFSYSIANRILSNTFRPSELNLENQLRPVFPS